MKYEAPTIDVIELDSVDIIQTSGDGNSVGGGGGGEDETPTLPLSLDSNY